MTDKALPMDRAASSELWRKVWEKKGLRIKSGETKPLHWANGYDALDEGQWDKLAGRIAEKLNLKGGESVLEIGCGAGAILVHLARRHPNLSLRGVDYSGALIDIARSQPELRRTARLDQGDARRLESYDAHAFDRVFAWGLLPYFDGEKDASLLLKGMLRLLKPGGMGFIGDAPDVEKKSEGIAARAAAHATRSLSAKPDPRRQRAYYSKSFFERLAGELGVRAQIRDTHEELTVDANDYYNAPYTFGVTFEAP